MPRGAQVVHNRLPIGMQKFVGFLAGTWRGTDKPVRFAHPFALKIEADFKKRTTRWLSVMRIGLLCGRSRVQNPGRTTTQGR